MPPLPPVLFEELPTACGRRLGIATLNAEPSLNALTLNMIRLLDERLSSWDSDDGIVAAVLRGAGDKAFCAGGDVRAIRQALLDDKQHPNPHAQAFFSQEYALDYRIHTWRKPLLVWGDGIVMGGGLGLLAGASHRVTTARTRIAMPEISIGLYPDIAASWFLQRMPAQIGLLLGLTGAPLNARDAVLCNLADHILPSAQGASLPAALAALHWQDNPDANHTLLTQWLTTQEQAVPDNTADSAIMRCLPQWQTLLKSGSLSALDRALREQTFSDPWLAAAARTYAAGSPSSAAITWTLFRRARYLSLAQTLRLELIVSINCCTAPDFREGVRALLVDKDRLPRWSPATLADIPPQMVAGYFTSPWQEQDHPLAALI